MNNQQLLQRLQDIEWGNFEVKAARKDISTGRQRCFILILLAIKN